MLQRLFFKDFIIANSVVDPTGFFSDLAPVQDPTFQIFSDPDPVNSVVGPA